MRGFPSHDQDILLLCKDRFRADTSFSNKTCGRQGTELFHMLKRSAATWGWKEFAVEHSCPLGFSLPPLCSYEKCWFYILCILDPVCISSLTTTGPLAISRRCCLSHTVLCAVAATGYDPGSSWPVQVQHLSLFPFWDIPSILTLNFRL